MVIFLLSCGLEDSVYFNPPSVLASETENGTLYITFTGYNQEYEGNTTNYLFVGYEIYYYFGNNSSSEKLAMVYNPIDTTDVTKDSNLIDFYSLNKNSSSNEYQRWVDDSTTKTHLQELYKSISLPVTIDMISDVLYEANNKNVRFCFVDLTDTTGDTNPLIVEKEGNYILMDKIYPNYDEYKNYEWGKKENDFVGFYDQDYYDELNIEPTSEGGNTYQMTLEVKAKGFNIGLRSPSNYTESIFSNTVTVLITPLDGTKTGSP